MREEGKGRKEAERSDAMPRSKGEGSRKAKKAPTMISSVSFSDDDSDSSVLVA